MLLDNFLHAHIDMPINNFHIPYILEKALLLEKTK